MSKFYNLILLCCLSLPVMRGQSTFPSNGAPYHPHSVYAFVHANIYTDPETLIEDGMLIIQDGKVLNAGKNVPLPANAVVFDLKGRYIYPSFIDLYTEYGLPSNRYERKNVRAPQMESNVKGAYGWNQAIRSNVQAHQMVVHNTESAEQFKKNGIGIVLSCPKDGIVRGSGVLMALNHTTRENESILMDRAAGFYSFSKGSSTQDYPSSLTGGIALLRQTYYDAKWYASGGKEIEYNISLDEFNRLQSLPSVIEAGDKYNVLRAARTGEEFGVRYIIKAGGNEYQRLQEIAATKLPLILPLNFPQAYDVEDPYDAESVSLAELKHWELAPSNAAFLEKQKVDFCFTAAGLKDVNQFLKNIRKAVQSGLSEKMALRALTTNPAAFIKASDRVGALKNGYFAGFFITNKSIFEEDAVVLAHNSGTEWTVFVDPEMPDLRGNYSLSFVDKKYDLKLSGKAEKPSALVMVDSSKKEMKYTYSNGLLSFNFSVDSSGAVRGAGTYNKNEKSVKGQLQTVNGSWTDFLISFVSEVKDSAKTKNSEITLPDETKIIYPFTSFGQPLPANAGAFKDDWNTFKNPYKGILIKNVTVWTNTKDSVLENHDVYIEGGKIAGLGKNLKTPAGDQVKIIDGSGKHLTPGIIDEHSHIALSGGVNEGAEASSAEVRMADVINPEDINIYRQLAGGVTTSQLLHGSANPIGGQSALIKLRWGHGADDLLFASADPFIKFALGENVKQSNWGDHNTIRFPQSRMGVEQVYNDFFTRAREYATLKQRAAGSKNAVFRRDLELDALAEILSSKRFITCHSYVQSEINMLMHVADSFKFKVNTFTHILEGYKVADKMKDHGVSASTFSDWWAYKNEVLEAIPYNAAILTRMGVNTAINSDDAEMARRLNQEAAKCVKYGGLSEVEALKLVTLNPARMLHIDKEVGSIKKGMSADVVLWTAHPLSVYALADKTLIDGRIYFDREEDAKLRKQLIAERARIISLLLNEKKKGAATVKPTGKQPRLYHCNTIEGVDEHLTGHR